VFDFSGFSKKAIGKEMTSFHPLIVSLKNEFENHADSIDSTPKGEIEMN
jgi:hypothetical protein